MKTERHLYIVYDIKDDSMRTHLSRRLAFYGLKRVQYSVFSGIMILKDKELLLKEITGMDLGKDDKVHVIDLCETCRSAVTIFGKMPEAKGHVIL